MNNNPIDFVVPWVDDLDPEWQKSFKKYSGKADTCSDSSHKRFRDWDLFKYWFRGVEKFAPWVNQIHLITCGHYPEWLNLNHPKLNLVKHEDYIPREHLPTFNSTTIEVNIHKIPNLAEHFVYFNDDIFLINSVKKEHFFKNGLPRDSAILHAHDGLLFSPINMNSLKVINTYFSKRSSMMNAPTKWFNIRYGKDLIRNILLFPWKNFTGFYNYHLTHNYLKSTFNEVWKLESDILNETSQRKFRHDLDLNQFVFRNWQLAKGDFYPIATHRLGSFYRIGIDPLEKAIASIKKPKKPIICLNDHDPENFNSAQKSLSDALNYRFPEKSSFEL